MTALTMLTYAVIYSILDYELFRNAIIFLSFASLINLSLIFINKAGKHLLAKLLLSVFTPFYMAYVTYFYFGRELDFQIYLFIAILIPIFLWGKKEIIYPAIINSLILTVYVYIEFFPSAFTPLIEMPENYAYAFHQTNVIACFIVAAASVIIYQYLYRLKENQLIKQAEELKISQAHKDKVYSIIGHDLRSPLSAFANLSQLMISDYQKFSDEKKLDLIKTMYRSSKSLEFLLENLLEWSSMQSGKIKPKSNNFNVKALAEESVEMHKELIEKKYISVAINIEDSLNVFADRQMISTVFRNLISNGIKFSKLNGSLSIYAERLNGHVSICVEDKGMGMTKSDLANLFNIRMNQSISAGTEEKGSGLGLLLCKDFIELHKGTIRVESELNSGSKFCFTLPSYID
jgi:signal transduction histidine kinase